MLVIKGEDKMSTFIVIMWLAVAAFAIKCLLEICADAVILHFVMRAPIFHPIFLVLILSTLIELFIIGFSLYMAWKFNNLGGENATTQT